MGSLVHTRRDADDFLPCEVTADPWIALQAHDCQSGDQGVMKDLMAEGAPYDENYPTCTYCHAWLRVMGPDVDPDEVTAIVGVTPTSVQRRGDPVEGRPGKILSRGGWRISTKGVLESKDVRHHLDWILGKVSGKESAFATLRGRGYLVDVCAMWVSRWGHGGPTVSPKQMRALADLGIDLWFDVYVGDLDD